MAVNVIVAAVTLLMAGFALVWLLRPDLRPWVEAPKYRVMSWDRGPAAGAPVIANAPVDQPTALSKPSRACRLR